MLSKKNYTNGQKVYELEGDQLTYFFKNGKVKAEGLYPNNLMEGEWKFYRETGQLWVVGNFKANMKDGSWIRYNKNDQIEYQETFKDNKLIKNRQ
jgi:antitoxin component YwqK of YwqJK toxin-antitoxin module